MAAPISPLRFVLLALVAVMLSYGAYFLLIDRWLVRPPTSVGESYKAFLLSATHAPRLIIDGGSSSHHGIDGELLTNVTGRATINLGDNGGYPLLHKVHRLRSHVGPGDVVLLPLEWFQYTLQGPPSPYVDLLTTSLVDYYRALPLGDRIALARQITLKAWARSLYEIVVGVGRSDPWQAARVMDFLQRPGSDRSGGFRGADSITPLAARPACDAYLLMNTAAGTRVSDYTLKALDELAELRRQGVDVVLTAPTVVGDDCYTTHADGYARLFASIREETQARGLRWLESPLANRLSSEFFRDTPYHAVAAGRAVRTAALLSHVGTQWTLPTSDAFAQSTQSDAWLRKQHAEILRRLPQWDGRPMSIVGASSATFGAGWSVLEPRGRWSLGTQSEIEIDLPDDARRRGVLLSLDARYYGPPEPTGIVACGRPLAPVQLDRAAIALAPDVLSACGERVSLRLHHRQPVAPSEVSASADHRKLKLFVRALGYTLQEHAQD